MKATDFTLPSTNKKNFTLKESLGKYVVLYFYPKDDTPGCTIETNDFNKLYSKFKKLDCEIYGISKDNIKSHDKFREKYKTTYFPTDSFNVKLFLFVEGKVKFDAFI